ncbi:MAG: hypothetical protein KC589_08745 [Nanoarchaeota archaeon]|nr:hypothetical protein [Nanoarchaeota archaeon]MCA9497008.1 hypothetical protein [Nanoarchaeota archaeon]
MVLEGLVWTLLSILLVVIISALPLHLAVSVLGGRSNVFKAFMVMILVAISTIIIQFFLPIWGVFISWLVLIWIFHEVFRLKWFKAVIAWILWMIFIFVFIFIFSLLGLSFFAFSLF